LWREANNEHQDKQTQSNRREKYPTNTGTHIQAKTGNIHKPGRRKMQMYGKERETNQSSPKEQQQRHTTRKKEAITTTARDQTPRTLSLT